MQLFASREARRRAVVGLLAIAVALGVCYVAARRYAPFVFDAEELRAWIDQFGVLAPLVMILIQALQVIVAPIPGQVVALASGYLFGPIAGTAYSLTGVLIGSAVAFSLSKRWGRSFVEEIIHDDVIDRFDGFVERAGIPGLLAFVVVPGLPDDVICFLAGLTKWSLTTFLVVITVGRFPAYVLTVYAGGQFATGQPLSAIALSGVLVAFSLLGYYNRERIQQLVQRLDSLLPF